MAQDVLFFALVLRLFAKDLYPNIKQLRFLRVKRIRTE